MKSVTRLVAYAVLLLLIFLAAALTAQAWLHRQTQRLAAEAVAGERIQFAKAVALTSRPLDQWDEAYLRELGGVIGGTVVFRPAGSPLPLPNPRMLTFDHALASDSTRVAQVSFPVPPTHHLMAAHQRVVAGLGLLALGLLALVLILALLAWRRPGTDGSALPWKTARTEMTGLAHLAKTSIAQGQALDRERLDRQRAEEDGEFKQRLLAQSLEEKIRLGRDLHDGIIQSLYAVGLTLESVRSLNNTNPAEADQRLGQCLENLNGTIRDVRAYITGLSPENLRKAGFSQALESLFAELRAGRNIVFDLRIDADATSLLTADQSAHTLQIAREAISNSLRHGRADAITVRLHQGDQAICLLVQDNGAGFDPATQSAGQGLGNMRARAEQVNGTVRVDSQPGKTGTRVVLTLPVLPSL